MITNIVIIIIYRVEIMTHDIDNIIVKTEELKQLINILNLALNNEESNTAYQYDVFMSILLSKADTLLEHVEGFNMKLFKEKMNL